MQQARNLFMTIDVMWQILLIKLIIKYEFLPCRQIHLKIEFIEFIYFTLIMYKVSSTKFKLSKHHVHILKKN